MLNRFNIQLPSKTLFLYSLVQISTLISKASVCSEEQSFTLTAHCRKGASVECWALNGARTHTHTAQETLQRGCEKSLSQIPGGLPSSSVFQTPQRHYIYGLPGTMTYAQDLHKIKPVKFQHGWGGLAVKVQWAGKASSPQRSDPRILPMLQWMILHLYTYEQDWLNFGLWKEDLMLWWWGPRREKRVNVSKIHFDVFEWAVPLSLRHLIIGSPVGHRICVGLYGMALL